MIKFYICKINTVPTMRIILLFLLIFISTCLLSQKSISGVVLSKLDKKPLESTSVYIDGSTIGTYTDSHGCFTLKNIPVYCRIIISHVACKIEKLEVRENTPEHVTIFLSEKETHLSGVLVKGGNSRRKQNLKEFIPAFLGTDRCGKSARILNDSVLYFWHSTDTILKPLSKKYIFEDVLHATTKTPLQVEMPLTGYTAFIDIESFTLKNGYENTDCNYVIYYKFITKTPKTDQQESHFQQYRKSIYYNSAKHFCKSIFANNLKKNGYLIRLGYGLINSTRNDSIDFQLEPYIERDKGNDVKIINMKNKQLFVYYFSKYGYKPLNLNGYDNEMNIYNNRWTYWEKGKNSTVIFKTDSCIIRSNGTIPDTNIMFCGSMAEKRCGSLLPDDYLPPIEQLSDEK